jgi:hypothetical protein
MTTPATAGAKVYGALAQFDSASGIFHACEKVRDAKYTKWDSHTPFAVHGLDRAMGLDRSILPRIVFVMGLTGAALAMTMQWWMSAVDYPVIIAAKPLFSWQAFIPITFESMVLFSALTTVLGMLALNGLPQWHHSLLKAKAFSAATDDKYFVSIESSDPKFDREATLEFLRSLGATQVQLVEE